MSGGPHAVGHAASAAESQPALHLDEMECALDGITTPAAAAQASALAAALADSDPEQIMLSLRGLPVFPNPPPEETASSTPEAAFVVAGGPTCLLREVLLAPYPHPEAPDQLYATIDAARKAQNISDFKPALRALQTVLLVWKKKHLWSVLRNHPDMTLSDGLAYEVRRASERRDRAAYKAAERERREEEEREFARKMAEQGENGEQEQEQEKPAPLAQPTHQRAEDSEDDEDDWEDDPAEWDDMPEDERAEHRRLRKKKQHEQVQEEVHVEVHKHEQPDEVLEFPTVTPEEELEFLTFYYNTLGTIYQSSGAAVIASGQTPGYNAPGVDGVRWGRMRVVPCPASSPEVSVMLQGITGNSFVATAVTAPPYAANLATSILEEEEPEESEEDYIASSPHDLSNSSDSRALIALWQAKRAHDLYLALREEEKQRAQAEAREAERQAKGKANGGAEEEDEDSTGGGGIEEMESNRDSSGAGGPDGQGGNLNTHTTLGLPGFSSINIPNLSLAQLQSESRALGLFGFPHISNLGSVGGPAQRETQAQGLSTQSRGESESNLIFWSTQPIVLPQQVQQKQPTESQKALGMTQQFAERQAALLQAGAAAAGPGAAQKLINPYTMCSAADAATYSNLGATLYHLGNFPLALRCFFVALQIRLATIRPQEDEYIDVATSLNNLGVVLSQLQYYQPAWEYFSAAHDLARGRLDPVHPRLNLIANNLAKIRPRRQAILQAPGIIQQLRAIAEAKEMKEHIAREKRNAKAAKKGAKGEKPTARKTARPLKKGEEVPKEFHEDTRFFRPPVDGQAPVVPKPVEGAPPGPLGSAAAAIQVMPLRQFDVEMSTFGKLMLEFGPAKKKAKAAGGKKKGGKK